MMVSKERARDLLEAATGKRILVVGDLMLDRYLYGGVDRISPEAPVPVVRVGHEALAPGGAANVARNIRALGGAAAVAGILGEDEAGADLRRQLEADAIALDGVEVDGGRPTTVKMRVVADRQQVVRVDWESSPVLTDELLETFCRRLECAIGDVDGVILEDYGKGVVCEAVVDCVLSAARKRSLPVGLDPKTLHHLPMEGLTLASPNRLETFAAAGLVDETPSANPLEDPHLLKAGECLARQWDPELLLLTLGPQGMLGIERGGGTFHVPTRAREVFDVSGAGDTVIATAMLALTAGATHREAAELANLAAGVVVAKLGTAACGVDELLEGVS